MGNFISLVFNFIRRSKQERLRLYDYATNTKVASLCPPCKELCPFCLDFLAQTPHEDCGIWCQSQSPPMKDEWFLEIYLDMAQLRRETSSACYTCNLLRMSLYPQKDIWESCTSARLLLARNLQLELLKGQNRLLLLELDIQQDGSKPHYHTVPSYPIANDPISDQSIYRIRNWIAKCDQDHILCSQDIKAQLPTRVIDLGPADGFQEPFLFEPIGPQRTANYLTLSHCWGGSQPRLTTKSTLNARKAGIAWSSLPRTFQDAALITRRLGFRYVWIDSLCIIQDDESDWQREGSQMASIYGASSLNIVASTAESSLNGFLRKRKNFNFEMNSGNGKTIYIQVRRAIPHNGYCFDVSLDNMFPSYDGGRDYPLYTRAWCFQERILAPRVLHFLPDELVFECMTKCFCECGILDTWEGTHLLKPVYADQFNQLGIVVDSSEHFQAWKNIVMTYSSRQLTFKKDCLPALSGIAHKMMKPGSSTYIAGLWKEYIIQGLIWSRQITTSIDLLKYEHSRMRPAEYIAPTFSWASITEKAIWQNSTWFGNSKSQRVQMLEVQCQLSSSDVCGQVTSGYIRLRGRLVPCRIFNERTEISSKMQLDIGGFVCLDAIEDTNLALDRNAMCLEIYDSQTIASARGSAHLGLSTALILTARITPGSYAELAFQNVRQNLSSKKLNELSNMQWYTRIGIVSRLSSDIFIGKEDSEIIIL